MSSNKIDQLGLGTRILTLGATMGSRAIAKILKDEGHDISYPSIHRYLTDNLKEREEATAQVKAAVQAELQKHALNDVEMLEKLRDRVAEMVFTNKPLAIGMFGPIKDKDGKAVYDEALWLKAVKELRETLVARMKIAGAGEDNGLNIRILDDIPK